MSSLVLDWAGLPSCLLRPTVWFSDPRRSPPRRARRPCRNLSVCWQEGNRAIAVIGLPRLFEASVCSGLSEDSNGARPADPLHAIYGMRTRSLLLLSVGAGDRQITTDRSIPLLSLAVPCFMPQICPRPLWVRVIGAPFQGAQRPELAHLLGPWGDPTAAVPVCFCRVGTSGEQAVRSGPARQLRSTGPWLGAGGPSQGATGEVDAANGESRRKGGVAGGRYRDARSPRTTITRANPRLTQVRTD